MNDYILTLRPVTIGTYPTHDTTGRALQPSIVDSFFPPQRTPDNRNHYGTVRYPEPLPFEYVWHYDLLPADEVERAHYTFWLYADRDAQRAAEIEEDWLTAGDAWLTQWCANEPLGEAALTILHAQKEATA